MSKFKELTIVEEYKIFVKDNFPKSEMSNEHNAIIKNVFKSIDIIEVYTNILRDDRSAELLENLKHQLFLIAFNLPKYSNFVFSSIIRNMSETVLRLAVINLVQNFENLLSLNFQNLKNSVKDSDYYTDTNFANLMSKFFSSFGKESQELHRTTNGSSKINFLEELNVTISIKKSDQIVKFLANLNEFILGHFSTQENINDLTLELSHKIALKGILTQQIYDNYFKRSSPTL